MRVEFHGVAWDHYQHWIDTDRATLRKLNRLIEECRHHPFDGTGKPEPLRGDFAGHRSRRIDREHRLVYRVEGETLIIVQCRYHY